MRLGKTACVHRPGTQVLGAKLGWLLRGALIREPLLVVSPWFEQRRDLYQQALLELSCTGKWDGWIAFFAEGVAASARASQDKVERLLALQNQMRGRVQDAGKRGAAERLAADLIGFPFVGRADVAARYELSGQGAANAIGTLENLGLLRRMGQRHGAQLWAAGEVISILSE